jgi:uncharacterized protein (TIGR02599 family)
MRRRPQMLPRRPRGLTLLEVLLSSIILSIVLLCIAAAISTIQSTWVQLRAKTDPFRTTRLALDTMSRRLSEATLQQRWETSLKNGSLYQVPQSDLHFVCGPAGELLSGGRYLGHAVFFQTTRGWDLPSNSSQNTAPLHDRLDETLNAWGYFIEYGADQSVPTPSFLSADKLEVTDMRTLNRFRLYEWRQPTAELKVFYPHSDPEGPSRLSQATGTSTYDWFRQPLQQSSQQQRRVSLVAEHVVAFALIPMGADTTPQVGQPIGSRKLEDVLQSAVYDSRDKNSPYTLHRLPKAFRLTALVVSPEAWTRQPPGQADSLANQIMNWTTGSFDNLQRIPQDFRRIADMLDQQRLPYKLVSTVVPMAEGNVSAYAVPQ